MNLDNALNKSINDIKLSSQSNLQNMALCKCPVMNPIEVENKYHYKFDGVVSNLVFDDIQWYKTHNLRVRKFNNSTRPEKTMTIDFYLNLITKNILFPMMLFINGKFQNWGNISIVLDKDCEYVLIENIPDHVWNLNMVLLPYDHVLYLEDCENDIDEVQEIIDNSSFYLKFNSSGIMIPNESDEAPYTIIGIMKGENIEYSETEGIVPDKFGYFNIGKDLVGDTLISPKNIFAFDSNHLFVHNFDKGIHMISPTTFTVDDESYLYDVDKIFAFAWGSANTLNKNPISRFMTNTSEYEMQLYNEKQIVAKYLDVNDEYKDREDNVKKLIYDILSYDQSILNNAYIKKSMIHVREFTVKSFIEKYRKNETSFTCKIPRSDNGYRNTEIILFIDGNLYKSHNNITKDMTYFYINLIDYKDKLNSDLEVLFFDNVQNDIYSTSISNGESVKLTGNIDPEDLMLFYNIYPDSYIPSMEYEINGIQDRTFVKVESDISKNNSDYSISFKDENFYNKTLKYGSKRQFRHQKIINLYDDLQNTFMLNEDFDYVKDQDHFLLFVNQRKLNPDNFIIMLPNTTSPFYQTSIELTTFLEKGDVLDIFYLPQSIETKMIEKDIVSGNDVVTTDNDNLNYNLSKDLEFFFVNGKYIHKKHIFDIQADQVAINNITSFYNVNVIYHIPEFEIVKEVYKTITTSEYTKRFFLDIMNAYNSTAMNESDSKFIELLQEFSCNSNKFTSSNDEKNFTDDHAKLVSALYNVIMGHYVPYGVKYNEDFVFDLDALKYISDSDIKTIGEVNHILTLHTDEGMLKYNLLEELPDKSLERSTD